MSVISKPPIEYYYDSHLTEEDRMSYNELQARLVKYLIDLLEWLFRREGWYIALDLAIYVTDNPEEVPTAPDVAVYKGLVLPAGRENYLTSWRVNRPESPPPAVVFEIASGKTWQKDLEEKPEAYARMGVREYVYFDPRPKRPLRSPHLRVWRMAAGTLVEVPADERGWVWSEELESWLVPEGQWLRLSEQNGTMRLTAVEAERAAKEAERAAKEAERAQKERAWAELRKFGVDPETLR